MFVRRKLRMLRLNLVSLQHLFQLRVEFQILFMLMAMIMIIMEVILQIILLMMVLLQIHQMKSYQILVMVMKIVSLMYRKKKKDPKIVLPR